MSAEVWLGALQLCLQPSVILFLCIGVCIGTVIGALPGLSATMGIAIMTPITFWFEPADGFAMLMGLWNAAIFAGGISAILVNTPGTPSAAATGWDGHPMALKGHATEALIESAVASFWGTVVGFIGLLTIAPSLACHFWPDNYRYSFQKEHH